MKTKKPNAKEIWKELEDRVVPRLRLSVIERTVYSHLIRHSRLEGKLRLRFSILGVAGLTGISGGAVRRAVRRLVANGALRLVERSKAGHLAEVRLPAEIRAVNAANAAPPDRTGAWRKMDVEEMDFTRPILRRVIHAREGGVCFYCLRQVPERVRCLDHVVPSVRRGRDSYRNLVSSCLECNSQKGERPADDFLRSLYRDRRLTAVEFADRLRTLEALAAGKLRPPLPTTTNVPPRKGRPRLKPTPL